MRLHVPANAARTDQLCVLNSSASHSPQNFIRVRGARQHNLKNIDVDIPRHQLVVLTGVSGSGKSSLAFDTLYAEGQRRYTQSLSAYARQFLDQLEKPDVDFIEGLSPAVAIEQRHSAPNPRSTIATVTEIHDYLRVLYAVAGQPHDPATGEPLVKTTPAEIGARVLGLPEGTKVIVLAPVAQGEEGGWPVLQDKLRRQGFVRARLDGTIIELDDPACRTSEPGTVEIVVDRLVMRESARARLMDSIETALKWNPQVIEFLIGEGESEERLSFTTAFANPRTGFVVERLTPRHFSFNTLVGACPKCEGTGVLTDTDATSTTCPDCEGKRLRPLALAVKLQSTSQLNIHEFCTLPVREALAWMTGLKLSTQQAAYCDELQSEIVRRLDFLEQVGLGYLTLNRESGTLSGGESQRIRLATQIGAGLSGVLYVLDEPSIGLHPSDNEKLIASLVRLRDLGNTVLVVEHDEAMMQAADWIIELGPGAGPLGGRITAQGTCAEIAASANSLTGGYLSGRAKISPQPAIRKETKPTTRKAAASLVIHEATEHNLQNVTAAFPIGRLTCVSGPSGSGKSTLVDDILVRALMRDLNGATTQPGRHVRITGLEHLDKIIVVDQSSIGRNARSNPATFTGAFGPIRDLFAQIPLARARGYGPGRFSFNTPGGRCERCAGEGVIKIDMHFLADVQVACEQCGGARFNAETLEVTFKGRNIAEVLDMSISEAARFFGRSSAIAAKLRALEETGLGYLRLGQPGNTLSGGEAQRVKLAAELGKRTTGRTLYVLDEPTTGLHFADIQALLNVLIKLRDEGNTLIVIEHHLDVIQSADWVIDLGPGGGSEGGRIMGAGTPAELAAITASPTGRHLRARA